MALVLILLLPAVGAAIATTRVDVQWKWRVTLLCSAGVFVTSLAVAARVVRGGRAIEAAGGSLVCDGLGALLLLMVAFVGLTAALFSGGYLRAREAGAARGGEAGATRNGHLYYVLYNLFLLSMLAVPLIAHIALIWIAIALTTLMSAFLVGYEDTPQALEAAWKYVVLTTLGAVLALLGFLILYWAARVAGNGPFTWAGLIAAAPHMPAPLVWTGFVLVLVGLGTKAGLVPMHTWLPDAHSQAPASICALLSGVETSTVLYAVLRLLPVVDSSPGLDPAPWFITFGLVSVGVAALLLIHVRDYKRLFAFSTVEHMGIVMVAAGLGGAQAHFGATYQLVTHALAKSLCFFAAGAVVLAMGTQEIANTRGLLRSSPGTALALLTGGLAIAGAPPFAVFVSEFTIFKAGLASGQYLTIGLLALFIVIAFCAVMAHLNRMLFGAPLADIDSPALPASCVTTLLVAAIPVMVLGVYVPSGLEALLNAAAAGMGVSGSLP